MSRYEEIRARAVASGTEDADRILGPAEASSGPNHGVFGPNNRRVCPAAAPPNALGGMDTSTDARGQTTTNSDDRIGRAL